MPKRKRKLKRSPKHSSVLATFKDILEKPGASLNRKLRKGWKLRRKSKLDKYIK